MDCKLNSRLNCGPLPVFLWGWLAGCLAGWLAGCLVGCLAWPGVRALSRTWLARRAPAAWRAAQRCYQAADLARSVTLPLEDEAPGLLGLAELRHVGRRRVAKRSERGTRKLLAALERTKLGWQSVTKWRRNVAEDEDHDA